MRDGTVKVVAQKIASPTAPKTESVKAYEYDRGVLCGMEGRSQIGCYPAATVCPEGQEFRGPLLRRPIGTGDEAWETYRAAECRTIGDPNVTPGVMASQWHLFELPKPAPTIQPDGYTLVNLDTIYYTIEDTFQGHVSLLGDTVEVEAWPVQYSWDPGDGSPPIVTETPGAPYPAHTITHVYTERGQATITLTVTWNGHYRVGSAEWTPIPSSTTTTKQATIDIKVARAYLVGDDH